MNSKAVYGLLSEREEQVLLLSTKGFTDKEIAKKLGLSIATVNTYWVRIRTKLGGANRAELVAAALQMNAEQTLTAKELENQRLISEIVRRAEAERALRESQSRLQSIIDGTPVVVFIKDQQGRYTLVNKEFESIMGRDRRDILGKRDADLLAPGTYTPSREDDVRVLESGETIEIEDILVSGDSTRTFLSVKFPLVNSEGVRYAVCGFSREITSRKEVEAALQVSEKRFRALIENSSDVVTLLSSNGTILYSSPSTERVLGYGEDIVGENAFTLIHRDDLKAIRSDFERLLKHPEEPVRAEYRVRRADGSFVNVEGVATNMCADPAVGAIVLNYRDVTARKRSERRIAVQYAVANILAEASSLFDAAPAISQALCETLALDFGATWEATENGDLKSIATWSSQKLKSDFAEATKSSSFAPGEGVPGHVLKSRKVLALPDIQTEKWPRSEAASKSNLHGALAFPIRVGDSVYGVVECLGNRVLEVDEELIEVLDTIGSQIGQFVERRRAELKLAGLHQDLVGTMQKVEEERARYRDLFEQAPDGYVVTNLEGVITDANQAAFELFGCKPDECINRPLSDFIVKDLKNAFNTGFAKLEELGGIHEWELKIRPKDRADFDASISVTVVKNSNKGAEAHRWLIRDVTPSKWAEHELRVANEALERRARIRTIELEEANLRLQEEVTERKQAEQDLLTSHQLVQSVIESSMDGIIAFDRQLRYTVWNKTMERVTGLTREEIVGQSALDRFPFLSETGESELMQKALRGESAVSKNSRFSIKETDRNGSFEGHYSPLRDDRGEIVGALGVIRFLDQPQVASAGAELKN